MISFNAENPEASPGWDGPDGNLHEADVGVYFGGGSTVQDHSVAEGSIGLFRLPTSWSTVRLGVLGVDNQGIGGGGIEASARLHSPTRLAPYVGMSTDLGFSGMHSGIEHNSGYSTRRPHEGDRISQVSGLAAIGPEAGLSYWVTDSVRVNAGATYYLAGGRTDFVLYGLSIDYVLSNDTIKNPSSWFH